MASVYLKFVPPPNTHDLAKLHIWEAPAADASFSKIDTITSIGSFPDWIDFVETTNAVNDLDWFAIQWETSTGVLTELSAPIQGRSETLVGEIIDRVMIRSPLLDENVVQQEAETVISEVTKLDPYTVDRSAVTYKQKSGITFLTMARAMLSTILVQSGSTQSYTAGLVSQNLGTSSQQQQSLKNIEQMIEWAKRDLNMDFSIILEIQRCAVAGRFLRTTDEITLEALGNLTP